MFTYNIQDDLSLIYSEKVYGQLNHYEHLLRETIYIYYITLYGHNWIEKFNSKVNNRGDKIKKESDPLETNNLGAYEIWFFEEKKIDRNSYKDKFQMDNLEKMNKKDLKTLIKNNYPLSLFEELLHYTNINLSDYKNDKGKSLNLNTLKSNISVIRQNRNRVAHNKNIDQLKYKELKEALDNILPVLEDLIIEIKERDILEQHFQNQADHYEARQDGEALMREQLLINSLINDGFTNFEEFNI